MVGNFKVIPITSEDTSFTNKDGRTINSYKVTVMQGEEVLSIPCIDSVYEVAKKYQFKECNAVITVTEGNKDGKVYKTYKMISLVG